MLQRDGQQSNPRTERELVLHFGAPKTGTSALQSFLAANSSALNSLGISYRNFSTDFCSHNVGNGGALHAALIGENYNELPKLFSNYFGENLTAIVSSELLSSVDRHQIEALGLFFCTQSITVRAVYYVRDIYPFLYSCYGQMVRNQVYTGSFSEYVQSNHVHRFDNFINIISGLQSNLTVLHYESQRHALCESFIRFVIGDEFNRDLFHDWDIRSYPSLSPEEIEILRFANRFPSAHFPGELSNFMLSNVVRTDARAPIIPNIVAYLYDNWQETINFINDIYFRGDPILKIVEESPGSDAGLPSLGDGTKAILTWAFERISGQRTENISQIVLEAQHLSMYSKKPSDVGFLLEFDPVAYLINNPDLLSNKINPYEHYLNFGKFEGRTWNFGSGPLRSVEDVSSLRLGERIRIAAKFITGR